MREIKGSLRDFFPRAPFCEIMMEEFQEAVDAGTANMLKYICVVVLHAAGPVRHGKRGAPLFVLVNE